MKRHWDTQMCVRTHTHTHPYNFKYFLKSTVVCFHFFWPSLVLLSYLWLNSPHHIAWFKQSMAFKDTKRTDSRIIYFYLHSFVLQNSLYRGQRVFTFIFRLSFYLFLQNFLNMSLNECHLVMIFQLWITVNFNFFHK